MINNVEAALQWHGFANWSVMGHGLWVSMDGFVFGDGSGELCLMAICKLH